MPNSFDSMLRAPNGEDEVFAFYGWNPDKYLLAHGEPDALWENTQIRVLPLPKPLAYVLKDPKTRQPLLVRSVRVHRLLLDRYADTFGAILEAGYWHVLEPYAGAYVFRLKRGSEDLSCHGLGCAIDNDPLRNPMGTVNGVCGALSNGAHPFGVSHDNHACRFGASPEGREVVKIIKAHGFFWGGDFKNRKDCMHWQFASGY